MTIRQATQNDSDSLIQLTSLSPMEGRISLRIDRKPDFFSLLNQRGESFVLVAEDEKKNILGSFSAAKQDYCIRDHIVPVYYLGDLKVHPDYSGSTIAYRLVKEMYDRLAKAGADLLFCNTVADNASVMPFFEGRAGIPAFRKTGVFCVYQLVPKRSIAATIPDEQHETLYHFYSDFNKRYDFNPVVHLCTNCIHFSEYRDNSITASITLFDPISLKQNVVIDYPLSIGIGLAVMRGLKPLFHLPALPSKGNPIRILYIKYFGFLPGKEIALMKLVEKARHYAFECNYHFVSVAINEKDNILNNLVKPKSRYVFKSAGLVTSLHGNQDLVKHICEGIPYEDYSLV